MCSYVVCSDALFQGDVTIASTTNSLLPTSGALKVAGGVGIGKNLNVAGNTGIFSTDESFNLQSGALVTKGGAAIGKNLNVGGRLKINSQDDSTDCLSGAIIVAGGVGIGKSVNVCGAIHSVGDIESDNNIHADLDVTADQDIVADRDLKAGRNLEVEVDATVKGNIVGQTNLNITGTITAGDDISTSANLSATGDLTVGGNSSVTGTSFSGGTITTNGGVEATSNIHTAASVNADLDVSAQRRIYQAGALLMPVGALLPYAGFAAPGGYLLCDGSAVSRTTYADLFSSLSTIYGVGNGTTTFNLPDLRGKMTLGVNGSHVLGSTGGAETNTLSLMQIPAHTHSGTTDAAGLHSHTVNDPGHSHVSRIGRDDGNNSNNAGQAPSGDADFGDSQNGMSTNSATTGITLSSAGSHTHTFITAATGGGQPFSILNPFMAINYIIKF